MLMDDFVDGFGREQNRLTVSIGVPSRRINETIHGRRAVIAGTALCWGRTFGSDPRFWLSVLNNLDVQVFWVQVAQQIEVIRPLQVVYPHTI